MPEDETTDSTEDDQRQAEDHLKVLRKKAKERDELEARAIAAERRLALRDAGIPDTPLGKLFEKGYDGDWADAEALKAAAVSYGVIAPPEPDTPTEEREAHERVAAASAGATGDPGTDWDAELAKARTEDEFYATYAKSGRPMKGRG